MGLKEKFYKVVGQYIEDKTQIKKRWEELTEQYTQAFRKYHNLNHLSELFGYFDTYNHKLKHPCGCFNLPVQASVL